MRLKLLNSRRSSARDARLLHGQPEETQQAARMAFENFFKAHEGPEGVSLPGAFWLASARA